MSFLSSLFKKKKSQDSTIKNNKMQKSKESKVNLLIDTKFKFNIKCKDLKLIALYSSNPSNYMSFINIREFSAVVLNFFEYVDSSFLKIVDPFLKNGSLSCELFFDKLAGMGIEEAYLKIKEDLYKKNLLRNSDSMLLFNTGFVGRGIDGFLMLIGVMVLADGKATVNVISTNNIQEKKVKLNINK